VREVLLFISHLKIEDFFWRVSERILFISGGLLRGHHLMNPISSKKTWQLKKFTPFPCFQDLFEIKPFYLSFRLIRLSLSLKIFMQIFPLNGIFFMKILYGFISHSSKKVCRYILSLISSNKLINQKNPSLKNNYLFFRSKRDLLVPSFH